MPRLRRPANHIHLWRLIGIVAVLVTVAAPTAGAYPVDPNWSPPTTVYIPETRQTIDGLFLDLWRSGGGAISYGNPITPEITAPEGQIIQYYQYARFEYWPEGDEQGNYVTLGEIGRELGPPLLVRRFTSRAVTAPLGVLTVARAWQPLSAVEATRMAVEQPSYRFVPETRHGVWGGFRAFWRRPARRPISAIR